LAGVTLLIPPLRERVHEIEPLARAFAEQSARSANRNGAPRISADAFNALRSHTWPGNVRELRNVIERAVLLCGGDVVRTEHLAIEKPRSVLPPAFAAPRVPAPSADTGSDRQRVIDALALCGGNQLEAAKHLGIARGTLIRRMDRFEIARPRKR
jgi:DNA-binding NtrC family response regulator